MKLILFSSQRRIKAFYEQFCKDALIPKAITLADFEAKILVAKYPKASIYQSLLIMKKACFKTKKLESELKIPSNFFAFLRNNEYIFSFFKELILARKRPLDLKEFDLYAQYEEHLEILDELYKNYFELLEKAFLSDELSLYMDHELNIDFLKGYEEIELFIDGFLNDFEKELLNKLSKYINIKIHFESSIFNLAYLKKNPFLSQLEIEADFSYTINLNEKKLLEKKALIRQREISYMSLEQRFLQAGFVFAKIKEYLDLGLKPENIAVITPDEDFVQILRSFDKDSLLSIARGISIKNTSFYLRLKALYEVLKEDFYYCEEKDYFKERNLELNNTKLLLYDIKKQYFSLKLDDLCDYESFSSLIRSFLENEGLELCEKIEQELLHIKGLLEMKLSLRELLELFFIKISKLYLSEVRGGPIRVIGLLESRGLSYEGLIIVDFNDDFIPKRSVNELFLNNELRKLAGLITYTDRENLQRHYYLSLISKAKKVALSYLENEEKIPSRFLAENDFKLIKYQKYRPKKLASYFNKKAYENLDFNIQKDFKARVDIEKPLSYSRFSSFKNKMDYFYQYILKIPEPKGLKPELDLADFGILLHEFLENFYKKYKSFEIELFLKELDKLNINPLDKAILNYKFKLFAKSEEELKNQGFEVIKLEEELKASFIQEACKLSLIGRIDRIDKAADKILLIDYKTGTLPKDMNQLHFYRLLYALSSQKNPSLIEAKFYDLKKSMTLVADKKNENYEKFIAGLKEFSKICKDELLFSPLNDKPSEYSPYKIIYKKELK